MRNQSILKNLLKNKDKIIIMLNLTTPITDEDLSRLKVADKITISGTIYTGRDAALPQLVKLIENDEVPFDLKGSVIMQSHQQPAAK